MRKGPASTSDIKKGGLGGGGPSSPITAATIFPEEPQGDTTQDVLRNIFKEHKENHEPLTDDHKQVGASILKKPPTATATTTASDYTVYVNYDQVDRLMELPGLESPYILTPKAFENICGLLGYEPKQYGNVTTPISPDDVFNFVQANVPQGSDPNKYSVKNIGALMYLSQGPSLGVDNSFFREKDEIRTSGFLFNAEPAENRKERIYMNSFNIKLILLYLMPVHKVLMQDALILAFSNLIKQNEHLKEVASGIKEEIEDIKQDESSSEKSSEKTVTTSSSDDGQTQGYLSGMSEALSGIMQKFEKYNEGYVTSELLKESGSLTEELKKMFDDFNRNMAPVDEVLSKLYQSNTDAKSFHGRVSVFREEFDWFVKILEAVESIPLEKRRLIVEKKIPMAFDEGGELNEDVREYIEVLNERNLKEELGKALKTSINQLSRGKIKCSKVGLSFQDGEYMFEVTLIRKGKLDKTTEFGVHVNEFLSAILGGTREDVFDIEVKEKKVVLGLKTSAVADIITEFNGTLPGAAIGGNMYIKGVSPSKKAYKDSSLFLLDLYYYFDLKSIDPKRFKIAIDQIVDGIGADLAFYHGINKEPASMTPEGVGSYRSGADKPDFLRSDEHIFHQAEEHTGLFQRIRKELRPIGQYWYLKNKYIPREGIVQEENTEGYRLSPVGIVKGKFSRPELRRSTTSMRPRAVSGTPFLRSKSMTDIRADTTVGSDEPPSRRTSWLENMRLRGSKLSGLSK